MKKLVSWIFASALLMIGAPFLAVKFAGDAGMAVCFILFLAVNPVYSLVCGIFAGADIKRMWALPIIVPVLFLSGVWIFFEMGEPNFLVYSGAYLAIGLASMLVRALFAARALGN